MKRYVIAGKESPVGSVVPKKDMQPSYRKAKVLNKGSGKGKIWRVREFEKIEDTDDVRIVKANSVSPDRKEQPDG